MTPSLKISQKIIDRLSQTKSHYFGKIYGILVKNNLTLLEVQVLVNNEDLIFSINSLPAEIYLCGVINIGDGNYDKQAIEESLTEVYVTDNPVFLNYNVHTQEITAYLYFNEQLESTKFALASEQDILSQFLHIRLKASVPLTCELSSSSIKDSFANLRKSIASGVMTFGFNTSSIYLVAGDGENGVVGIAGNPTIGELCDQSNDPGEGSNKKKKNQQYEIDVMQINLFKKMTHENGVTKGKEHAPLCVLDKKQCKTINIMIPFDALSMVHRQVKAASLYEIIVESAVRNLRLLEETMLNNLQHSKNEISEPEIFHFYPEECDHFITNIYLKNDSEDDLLSQREKLHQELLLNQNRPRFRRPNAFMFKTKNSGNEPLMNPHVSVRQTDNGGQIALVKGKYLYYHYCQNKMDDNGWGCAYRSLQTLASWFKIQGYTDKDVPTFKDIQKCLVDIGDKPPNFIGSRQWIGSTEVNFVLNSLLGVISKILYVSSGEEMSTKGPELVSHFENHGSPIMIGGGVLAHTILGVDYNSQTGDLKFLILDPHYTGSEDLHTILSKGWCGWKGVDFWDKTAYYNMCLPQVPRGI